MLLSEEAHAHKALKRDEGAIVFHTNVTDEAAPRLVTLGVRIPEQLRDRLVQRARIEGFVTLSPLIRKLLESAVPPVQAEHV